MSSPSEDDIAGLLGLGTDRPAPLTDDELAACEELAGLQENPDGWADLGEAGLERLQGHFGGAALAAVAAEAAKRQAASVQQESPLQITATPTSSRAWWQKPMWRYAMAASVLIVAGVALVLSLSSPTPQPDSRPLVVRPGPNNWEQTPPFDPSGQPLSRVWTSLANVPPDWSKTGSQGLTMGPDGSRKADRQLATVIVQPDPKVLAFGSGAIISSDGWILTNYHVVEQASQGALLSGKSGTVSIILAEVADNRLRRRVGELPATVFRVDPTRDLALVKLDTLPTGEKLVAFSLAPEPAKEGTECYAVGSEGGGPAWTVRSGEIERRFEFPTDITEAVLQGSTEHSLHGRPRATVLATDVGISGGDSGGPLLDPEGRLIGLTFATPKNRTAGRTGWHIDLIEIKTFLASGWPKAPELPPVDFWTAGIPGARPLAASILPDTPEEVQAVRIDLAQVPESESTMPARAVAVAVYFRFAKDGAKVPAVAPKPVTNLLPRGLWGGVGGTFRFDLAMLVRHDGVVIVGYTDDKGDLDRVRIGKTDSPDAEVSLARVSAGAWTAPTGEAALLDTKIIPAALLKKAAGVLDEVLSPGKAKGQDAGGQGRKPSKDP